VEPSAFKRSSLASVVVVEDVEVCCASDLFDVEFVRG
jgi:hypothetical protein